MLESACASSLAPALLRSIAMYRDELLPTLSLLPILAEELVMKHRTVFERLRVNIAYIAVVSLACMMSAVAAENTLPAMSPEGLKLVPKTKVSALYLREGANFSGYDKVTILDCYVAFRKDWLRDQNRTAAFRVSDSDMMRIKTELAEEFKRVFSKRLTAKGEKVVTAAGTGVLILRPAIVNLDVAAPDTRDAGRTIRFTDVAGQATLFLELYDSVTNELLARVIDAEVAGENSLIKERNAVTNRAAADRMLSDWADLLGTFLQNARSSAPMPPTPSLPK
jgi:hypothetical protein